MGSSDGRFANEEGCGRFGEIGSYIIKAAKLD